jgi:glutamyl-tRNA synthetase
MMAEQRIRVRFAPSPTGHLHIGGARTALFNWLYARKTGGAFVLRIEDTDAERSTATSYRAILDALEWLGLDWDEGPVKGGPYGPYQQSARQVLYHTEARKLVDLGAAYHCFCTPQELEEMRNGTAEEGEARYEYDGRCRNLPADEVADRLEKRVPHVIRFKMPPGETKVYDLIRGAVCFNNDDLDDFVLIKSDGRPTYNFAAAIDDAKMRITHIIRGDDHLSNSPKQILLYKALDYQLPKFAHLPMILGSDRGRLSKRHGATSVQEFRRLGYLSDSMVNYLALLGWAFDDKTEFFTRESLIQKFSLKRVGKNPAAFDPDKLNHIDGEHFKQLPLMEKVALVFDRLQAEKVFPADFGVTEWSITELENGERRSVLEKREKVSSHYRDELPRLAIIIKVMGNRLRNLKDASGILAYFYKDDYEIDDEAYCQYLAGPETAEHLRRLAVVLEQLERFDRSEIEEAVRALAGELGIKAGELIHPCRVALTGQSVSPDIFSVIHLLGHEKSVERLHNAVDHITSLAER